MINKRIAAVVITCLAGAAAVTTAQSERPGDVAKPAAGTRTIAVVDVVRIFTDSAQIKDLNERMRRDTEDYGNEAKRRREQLDNRQIELRAFKPGTPDYETRRKELLRMTIEANVWAKAREEDMERQKYDWTIVIYGKVIDVCNVIAKERGHEVVLQSSEFKPSDMVEQEVNALRRFIQQRTVIYNVPETDITDLVLRRLNDEYRAANPKPAPGGATTQPAKP